MQRQLPFIRTRAGRNFDSTHDCAARVGHADSRRGSGCGPCRRISSRPLEHHLTGPIIDGRALSEAVYRDYQQILYNPGSAPD